MDAGACGWALNEEINESTTPHASGYQFRNEHAEIRNALRYGSRVIMTAGRCSSATLAFAMEGPGLAAAFEGPACLRAFINVSRVYKPGMLIAFSGCPAGKMAKNGI